MTNCPGDRWCDHKPSARKTVPGVDSPRPCRQNLKHNGWLLRRMPQQTQIGAKSCRLKGLKPCRTQRTACKCQQVRGHSGAAELQI